MTSNTRRVFLSALGAALAWPRWGVAQPAERTFRLGWLSTSRMAEPYNIAFVQRLRELGFVEGRNLVIEFRVTEGRPERRVELAADLARQDCDVLLAPQDGQGARNHDPVRHPGSHQPDDRMRPRSARPRVEISASHVHQEPR